MPWPVSACTYRPSITLIFCLSGSKGERVFDSFISAPWPSALQWSSLMPQPRNTTPNRFGNADAGGVSADACNDSRKGSATVQPAPRNTARREIGSATLSVSRDMVFHLSGCNLHCGLLRRRRRPPVAKLRAQYDGLKHRIEAIAVRGEIGLHGIDQTFI